MISNITEVTERLSAKLFAPRSRKTEQNKEISLLKHPSSDCAAILACCVATHSLSDEKLYRIHAVFKYSASVFFLGKRGAGAFSQKKSTVAVICDDDSFSEKCEERMMDKILILGSKKMPKAMPGSLKNI